MTSKATQSSSLSKVTFIVTVIVGCLCFAEFVRLELMYKEQNRRMDQLEHDKMTSTHNNNVNGANIRLHKPMGNQRYKREIVRRTIQDVRSANQSRQTLKDELKKTIHQEVGRAVATLQAAKFWIPIPGPPGSPGKPGDNGQKGDMGLQGKRGSSGRKGKPGRRGKQGPRGFKGVPGQNGTPGPRGLPGLKGDRGLTLAAPSVIVSPTHLIINQSKTAIFHCSASGYPRPDIVWSKVNGSLAMDRSIAVSSGKLEIKHVSPNDTGIYQCKASNIIGKVQTTLTLEVNFRPRLTLNKGPIYVKMGKRISLPTCHVTGHPKPKVTWSKAIGTLPNSRTVIKDGQLTLLSSHKDDSGTYLCKAENLLGSVISGSVVVVVQLPVFVIKPPTTVKAPNGSRITLDCSAKGDPQPVISWRKKNDVLPAGRYEIRDGSLILRDLRMTDSGVYVCTAMSAGVFNIDIKSKLYVFRPIDCSEFYKAGERRNGVYTVQPDDQGAFQVYCDMTTDGGGWTVLQRRQDGSVDFYRNWQQYKTGFGNLTGEFWLGNDYIHRLTARTPSSFRVDLEDWDGTWIYAKYGSFSVGDESHKYRLRIGSYSGNAGDSMAKHNNMDFTTKDRDNDVKSGGNCAVMCHGAWWYNSCYVANLNGLYAGNKKDANGIVWDKYKMNWSLKTSKMKVRPQDF